MADVDISLSGMGDVIDRLNALPRSLKKKALRKGIRAGCNIIRDDARRNAPVDTGLTARNIVTQISSTKDKVIGKVGVRGGGRKNGTNPFYWRFIELGYLHKNSGVFIKANPFMRNAQSKNKEPAITKVAEAIKAELDNMA